MNIKILKSRILDWRSVFIYENTDLKKKYVIKIIKRVIYLSDTWIWIINLLDTKLQIPFYNKILLSNNYILFKYNYIDWEHKNTLNLKDLQKILDFEIYLKKYNYLLDKYYKNKVYKEVKVKEQYLVNKKYFDIINKKYFNNIFVYSEVVDSLSNLQIQFIAWHLHEENVLFENNKVTWIIDLNLEYWFVECIIVDLFIYYWFYDSRLYTKYIYKLNISTDKMLNSILLCNLLNYIKWYPRNTDSWHVINTYINILKWKI